MAEEHRCEAPEGHHLCANNCGFFGSPATLNLCSKCYSDFRLKEEQASSAKSAVEKSLQGISPPAFSPLSSSSSPSSCSSGSLKLVPDSVQQAAVLSSSASPAADGPPATQQNRCATCRKRVGLTGFRCRCGTTFCGAHRYPEQHACAFDFKASGREAIAKANPVVKAAKLEKI